MIQASVGHHPPQKAAEHWRGLCGAQTEQVWRHHGQGLAGLRGHVEMLLGTAVVT